MKQTKAILRPAFATAAILFAGAQASAQQSLMSAEELARMFSDSATETVPASPKTDTGAAAVDVAYTADELARILTPNADKTGLRMRGLAANGGANDAAAEPGQEGSGVVPDLQINFAFNSADLTEQARAQLDALGEAMNMQELANLRFMIGGHTDARGSNAYNQQLSQARAERVTRYLQSRHAVNASRLTPRGYGETQLADPADPDSWVNRRVEVRTDS